MEVVGATVVRSRVRRPSLGELGCAGRLLLRRAVVATRSKLGWRRPHGGAADRVIVVDPPVVRGVLAPLRWSTAAGETEHRRPSQLQRAARAQRVCDYH
eukprot:scaffold40099_cov65-Phaeocystis_antarctica.AAC.4